MKKRVILQPEYMKKFKCTGPKCEDTCCSGWKVSLDKKTFLRYKRLPQTPLKTLIEKNIKRKHNKKTDYDYGSINMAKDGSCPILVDDGLCNIHKNLGEDYLSNTCAIYPRYENKVNNMNERSATMSCPELATVALLNSEEMEFEYIESLDQKITLHNRLNTEDKQYSNKAQKYFWDIRTFSISLLQNREYDLDERLIILGMFYKKIEKIMDEKEVKEIPIIIETMKDIIGNGELKDELEKIPKNTHIQMRVAKELLDIKLNDGTGNERYLECLKDMLSGLGYHEGEKFVDIVVRYEENYEKYFSQYIKEKEYILENFLVNEYFKEMMPFGKAETIWDSYILLCILYSMIKLHLIGMAGHHKGLDDDLVLKLIQSFSRLTLHNPSYIQNIVKLIKDNNYDSLAYMSILVKN